MDTFKITTDNTADLPAEYVEKHGLKIAYLSYLFEGESYGKHAQLDPKIFYRQMRAGSIPVTSQINPDEAKMFFEEVLKETKNILHIAFSSELSGTYNSLRLAAEEIMSERSDCKIFVIDSKCASLGEGLLVDKAIKMRDRGCSMEEIETWVYHNRLHLLHVFTVDDLNHLYRGGRVSKMTAVVGTMVNIKPLLKVNDEGKLVPYDKTRGRKKSLTQLVDYMEERMGEYRCENDTIFISHGDALEDAEFVAEKVKERFGIEDVLINMIGPSIGAHSGPGTIALFFYGTTR